MMISGEQCRAARALLGLSQDELARASKVAKATIANFEVGKRQPYGRTLDDLREALETSGVEFIPENGGGAGVRLRKPKPVADDDEESWILEWPAGKPLPRNYRDGANDLLNDEDRLSDEQMEGMRQARLARQDAEAAAKAAPKPNRTRKKTQP